MQETGDQPAKAGVFDYLWSSFWALCSVFCVVMLPVVIWQLHGDQAELEAKSEAAVGVVVKKHCKRKSSGGHTCRTEVRFKTAKGKVVNFIEPTRQDATVGQKVKVRYMPSQPDHAQIDSEATEQGYTLYYVVFSIMTLVFGIIAFFSIRSIYRLATRKTTPKAA